MTALGPRPRAAAGVGRRDACVRAGRCRSAGLAERAVLTMMPGETPPPPAGTAAAVVACANCGVLQQVAVARCPCGAGAPGAGFACGDAAVELRGAAGGWEGPRAAVTARGAAGARVVNVVSDLCKGAAVASFSRAKCVKVARVSAACLARSASEFPGVSF